MNDYKHSPSRRTILKMGLFVAGSGLISLRSTDTLARSIYTTPDLSDAEIQAIEKIFGKKGKYNKNEATHNTSFPRNDLNITIKARPIPISFGFGGWTAIKRTIDGKNAVLMSDCILLQEEVNPLISAALEAGLEIGAIHNHFFYEEPRIFYMHLHGMGNPVELAQKYANAIAGTKIAVANQPIQTTEVAKSADQFFNITELNKIIGMKP